MTNMSKDNMKEYIAKERKRISKQMKELLAEAKEHDCHSLGEYLESEVLDESARDSVLDEIGHINGQIFALSRLEDVITEISYDYETYTFSEQGSVLLWDTCGEFFRECPRCELVLIDEEVPQSDDDDMELCPKCRKAYEDSKKGKRKGSVKWNY